MNAAEAFGQYLALIQDNIGLFDKRARPARRLAR